MTPARWFRRVPAYIAAFILAALGLGALQLFFGYRWVERTHGELQFIEDIVSPVAPEEGSKIYLQCAGLDAQAREHLDRHLTSERILGDSPLHRSPSNQYYFTRCFAWLPFNETRADGQTTHTSEIESSTAVVIYSVDQSSLDRALDPRGTWKSTQFGRAPLAPDGILGVPVLKFRIPGQDYAGIADFGVDNEDDAHLIVAAVRKDCRILYLAGSIRQGTWQSPGLVLAKYPRSYSPQVSAVADTSGTIHLFWIERRTERQERLIHVVMSADAAPRRGEIIGSAEILSYRALPMSNGDIAVLCKGYNVNYYGIIDALGFRIGGDISMNLRVLHQGKWSRGWARLPGLPLAALGGVGGESAHVFYPGVRDSTVSEIGDSQLGILMSDGRGAAMKYHVYGGSDR